MPWEPTLKKQQRTYKAPRSGARSLPGQHSHKAYFQTCFHVIIPSSNAAVSSTLRTLTTLKLCKPILTETDCEKNEAGIQR